MHTIPPNMQYHPRILCFLDIPKIFSDNWRQYCMDVSGREGREGGGKGGREGGGSDDTFGTELDPGAITSTNVYIKRCSPRIKLYLWILPRSPIQKAQFVTRRNLIGIQKANFCAHTDSISASIIIQLSFLSLTGPPRSAGFEQRNFEFQGQSLSSNQDYTNLQMYTVTISHIRQMPLPMGMLLGLRLPPPTTKLGGWGTTELVA